MADKYDKPEVLRDKCIGAGNCVALAEEAFELDNENIAIVKDDWSQNTDEQLLDAAKSCPTAAIVVKEKGTGKQVYP